MIKNKMKIVKDGSKIRVIVNKVDTGAPVVQVVGHEYQFNSKIICDQSFSAYEFSQMLGFGFLKGDIEWSE